MFTYGPLGFLAYPNLVWLPGAILGLLYTVAVTFAFLYLVCRELLTWIPSLTAVVLTAGLALVAAQAFSVPEIATAALVLWSLTLVRPGVSKTPLPAWIPPLLGAAAALQLLVKFGAGSMALATALLVTVARPPRLRNLALMTSAFLVAFLALWITSQQSVGNIGSWLSGSLRLTQGYSAAMVSRVGFAGKPFWLLWLGIAGTLLASLWRLVQHNAARAFPSVALVILATWFFTKEGFTRLDRVHANVAYVCIGALIAAVPWERRLIPLGIAGLSIAVLAAAASAGTVGTSESPLRALATHPAQGLEAAARIVRATIQPSYRSHELDAARRSLAKTYGIPQTFMDGLRNATVHADPWEVAAVWTYNLRWRPVPVFQTYSAYTSWLDDLNADSLASRDGPDAVIRQRHPVAAIGNLPAWESPEYMVSLTCRFERTAESREWQLLTRASDVCGLPRPTTESVVRAGETLRVPRAQRADDIVVATFDYPTTTIERLATGLLKPLRQPRVLTNGKANTFVVGTASQFHLLQVPESIGTRAITNAGLDIRSLTFPNAHGAVTVHFYEFSTSRSRVQKNRAG